MYVCVCNCVCIICYKIGIGVYVCSMEQKNFMLVLCIKFSSIVCSQVDHNSDCTTLSLLSSDLI